MIRMITVITENSILRKPESLIHKLNELGIRFLLKDSDECGIMI